LWLACLQANKTRSKPSPEAIWQFQESISYFSVVDHLFRFKTAGIFCRYEEYFTWSRWNKALFLSRIPTDDTSSNARSLCDRNDAMSNRMSFGGLKVNNGDHQEFQNFHSSSATSQTSRFLLIIVDVLSCKALCRSVSTARRRGYAHHVPCRFVDSIFEWLAFVFIVFIFPLCMLFYIYLILGCQPIL